MKVHRIVFEKVDGTEIDDEGVEQAKWVEDRKAWASVENRHGSQKWQAGGYSESVTNLFRINYIPSWEPTSQHRIKWKDDLYDIESVDNIRFENLEYEIRAVRHERTVTT